jgi:hypothetical protein
MPPSSGWMHGKPQVNLTVCAVCAVNGCEHGVAAAGGRALCRSLPCAAILAESSASSGHEEVYVRSFGRLVGVIAGLALCVFIFWTIILSPLVFTKVDAFKGQDWVRLSDIGQSYGAISAGFSALTLAGVVAGIAYQGRQVHAQRQQGVRQFHFELVKMNLENNELYGPSWGPQEHLSKEQRQRHLYTNQMMQYLSMGFSSGILNEAALRGVLADVFRGQVGRDYWEVAEPAWIGETGGRPTRFSRIAKLEYDAARARGPGVTLEPSESPRPLENPRSVVTVPKAVVLLVTGASIGAMAGWLKYGLTRRRASRLFRPGGRAPSPACVPIAESGPSNRRPGQRRR